MSEDGRTNTGGRIQEEEYSRKNTEVQEDATESDSIEDERLGKPSVGEELNQKHRDRTRAALWES
jgi:hypothetical protein